MKSKNIIIFVFILLIPPYLLSAEIPNDVQLAAQKGLEHFIITLDGNPRRAMEKYNLGSDEDPADAVLGVPYELYEISLEDAASFQDSTDLFGICEFHSWRYPILIGKIIKAFLSVECVEYESEFKIGCWITTGFGPNSKKEYLVYNFQFNDPKYKAIFIHQPSKTYLFFRDQSEYFLKPLTMEARGFICPIDKTEDGWYPFVRYADAYPCMRAYAFDALEHIKAANSHD